jgi:hypothetical protein
MVRLLTKFRSEAQTDTALGLFYQSMVNRTKGGFELEIISSSRIKTWLTNNNKKIIEACLNCDLKVHYRAS